MRVQAAIALMVDQLTIKQLKPAALKDDARNARTHPPEQIEQLKRSITEYGFNVPVLIDKHNVLIAGHARCEAARQLELDTIPTIMVGHLSDTQRRAFMLADNRIQINAGWDDKLLAQEIESLLQEDVEPGDLGFSQLEIDRLLGDAPLGTDNDPTTVKAVTQAGDIWEMDYHRLVCGDATDAKIVELCLGKLNNYPASATPHLMVTDPPYNVEYGAEWRAQVRPSESATGEVLNDNTMNWITAFDHFPGSVAYCWCAAQSFSATEVHFNTLDFQLRNSIIWNKDRILISRGHYHWKHETCLYLIKKGCTAHWNGSHKEATVWDIPNNIKNETGHSTQKPIETMARPMRNNSKRNEYVYDPFVGSGTTIIAAEQLARRALCIELSPHYCDIAVRRWENHTGKKATLIRGRATHEK